MPNNVDYEVIISTCDKYSDLWDAHILLMNENWKERGRTWLVTDAPTVRTFEGVNVICAGVGMEITQRLKAVLEKVETEYILFTLDDYFLTQKIDNGALQRVLAIMKEERLDFLRLYSLPKSALRQCHAVEFSNHKGVYLRPTEGNNYSVSLYPGLWRTDFMRKTLDETMNAWQYEVALTDMANKLNARCAVSNNGEFPFLDVIRKGKVLRKANCYFKKNPIYQSERAVRTVWEEFLLNTRSAIAMSLPRPVFRVVKYVLVKLGAKFYSPVK